MAYDAIPAIPELDNHFLALATSFIIECRNVLSIDPTAKLGPPTGGELVAVAMSVASLHMKHVRFTAFASAHYKEIAIPRASQSGVRWTSWPQVLPNGLAFLVTAQWPQWKQSRYALMKRNISQDRRWHTFRS